MFITHLDICSSSQYSRLNQRHGKDPVYSFYTNLSVFCYTQENGVLIESMDACFGLARKIAKGGNRISSRHRDLLFSDQDDVDNFVDNYPHCGNKSPDQVYLGPLSLLSELTIKGSFWAYINIILLHYSGFEFWSYDKEAIHFF